MVTSLWRHVFVKLPEEISDEVRALKEVMFLCWLLLLLRYAT